jgi:hypothetical protein
MQTSFACWLLAAAMWECRQVAWQQLRAFQHLLSRSGICQQHLWQQQ